MLLLQCAGFLPRDPEYAALLENAKVDVPTLFVMGRSDALIPPARSHALMDTFDQRTADMFEHPGEIWGDDKPKATSRRACNKRAHIAVECQVNLK